MPGYKQTQPHNLLPENQIQATSNTAQKGLRQIQGTGERGVGRGDGTGEPAEAQGSSHTAG